MDDYLKGSNMLYVEALCPQLTASPSASNHEQQPYPNLLFGLGREPRHISYGDAAMASEIGGLDPLAGGPRIHQLYLAGLKVGSLVGGDEIRYESALATLTSAGRTVLGLSDRDVRKTVEKAIQRGMKSPRMASPWGTIRDSRDAILHWVAWWDGVTLDEFKGTKQTNLLRLLAAFALKGITVGCVDIRFSVREASELAGFSTNTVNAMLKPGGRVEASGYLKAVKRARPGDLASTNATTWRPMAKRENSRQDVVPQLGIQLSRISSFASPSANVFHGRSIVWRLYSTLTDEEVEVSPLASFLGVTKQTVRDNLHYLASHGLAERVTRTTWRGFLVDTRDLPARDGVDHQGRRRERHQAERAHYALWVARRNEFEVERRQGTTTVPTEDAAGHDPEEPCPIWDDETGEIVQYVNRPMLV